jgi:thioredoxin-dependent peroxiredoxin
MTADQLIGKTLPNITFKTRQKDKDGNFDWVDITTTEISKNKKIIIFSLPGAFTPTCSTTHLPGYEINYDELKKLGIDEVYCLSVNDSFVMNAWAKDQGVKNIKMLPDGSGELSEKLGMLVKKDNLGFGKRSWRYSMYVDNGTIKQAFIEPGFADDCPTDPFEVSDVYTMINYLKTL